MESVKNAQVNAQAKKSSNDKTRLSYWRKRIFKPVYDRDGQKITSPNYCAEIQHKGKRVRWSLGPASPEAAATRARDLYLFLITNGWQATLIKYRPATLPQADPSVGAFIEQIRKSADLGPTTLRDYINALQRITSDIAGLSDCPAKFGQGKGRKAWLARVHSVKLSELSLKAVQQWKISFLSKAGDDPISQRSAKVSVNSYLRQARSLFSPRILKHVDLELPSPLPFEGVEFEPRPSCKYRSSFNIAELVSVAREELANSDPEAYKVFLLGAMVGLRRKEIDLLEWDSFLWDQHLIRIQTTQYFEAKSEDSLGDVYVEPQLMEIFRRYYEQRKSPFVIESDQLPRLGLTYRAYRSEAIFGRLIVWLKMHGVHSLKPLHTLRKEFGSEVCKHAGIYAASMALRHSDIKITTQYYVQDRSRATVGLGHLLEETPKVVAFVA
jgi:integrase